ncbi:hypothetical protein ACFC0S_16315 [Streptomyces sp. NPDC056084]|uniref:hypothetical protein n=1 Tax=unclassified Streptomyces TaxID=2593676 RepID=UPI0035D61015
MALSVSIIVLLAIILVALMRSGSLKTGPAIAAVLFGFSLASTGMAPTIHQALKSGATAIAAINL